jgi:hypothetical protein
VADYGKPALLPQPSIGDMGSGHTKTEAFALLRRLKAARRACSPGVSTLFYTYFYVLQRTITMSHLKLHFKGQKVL